MRSTRRVLVVVALAAVMLSDPARGEPALEERGEESPPVSWKSDWARMRAWEYIATSAVMTEAFIVRFAGPDPPHDQWGLGIDEDIVEAVAITGTTEDVVRIIGHVGYIGSMAYRLVDSAFLPWIIWDSPDVAWQMSWIDLEAFAIVAGVLWNVQLAVGRERPEFRDCPDDAPDDIDCVDEGGDRWRSFIAGHVAVAATATGLTCVHHAHLPLYGGGFGDDFACGTMIGVTAAVSAARLMAEKHYPSDVVLGLGLGAVAGYVVPSALHYGFGATRSRPLASERTSRPAVTVTLVPLVAPGRLGGAVVGVFDSSSSQRSNERADGRDRLLLGQLLEAALQVSPQGTDRFKDLGRGLQPDTSWLKLCQRPIQRTWQYAAR